MISEAAIHIVYCIHIYAIVNGSQGESDKITPEFVGKMVYS